jgi:hypothetical protein
VVRVEAPALERSELSPEREYAIGLAHLVAKREALLAAIPPDHSKQLGLVKDQIAEQERDLKDLQEGRGRWWTTELGEVGYATKSLGEARIEGKWAEKRWERRWWSKEIEAREAELERAEERKREIAAPHINKTESTLDALRLRSADLETKVEARRRWLEEHPDASRRLSYVKDQIGDRRRKLEEHLRRKSGHLTPLEKVVRQSQRSRSRRRDGPYRTPYAGPTHAPNRDLGHGFGR